MLNDWINKIESRGFKKDNGTLYKHAKIIYNIKLLMKDRDIEMSWVKGHSSSVYNELADELCGKIVKKYLSDQKYNI